MKYRVDDWAWTPDRLWKITELLYSANMTLMLYEHILELYEFFSKEDLEQIKRNLKNTIQHLARALELEKENEK